MDSIESLGSKLRWMAFEEWDPDMEKSESNEPIHSSIDAIHVPCVAVWDRRPNGPIIQHGCRPCWFILVQVINEDYFVSIHKKF